MQNFSKFVKETKSITVAEASYCVGRIKGKQCPRETQSPMIHLQPGLWCFKKNKKVRSPNLYDFSQWWSGKDRCSWRHPNGPESLFGKENEPLYKFLLKMPCLLTWAGKDWPTEAERSDCSTRKSKE